MTERRRYERFQLPLSAVVQFDAGGAHRREKTRVGDIAIGGAKFPLLGRVEIGSEIDLSLDDANFHLARALGFKLDRQQPFSFHVTGRVVRHEVQNDQTNAEWYAVEFLSPLRISRSAVSGSN